MIWNHHNILTVLAEEEAFGLLTQGRHGLERETLRTNPDGTLALTPHPRGMSDPFTDAQITTDFSESQLEFITAPHESIDGAITELTEIHQRAIQTLENNELLWPSSMPPILPDHDDIPVAQYGDDPKAKTKEIYRNGLANRYGKYVQTLCGVHYNMSFSDDLWQFLQVHFGADQTLQDFKNQHTLGLVRTFIRKRWLLAYLLGATPFRDKSYRCKTMAKFEMDTSIALRLSRCGYHNPEEVKILYNDFSDHLHSIETAMNTPYEPYRAFGGPPAQLNDHLLQIANEYYFPIRMKPTPHDGSFLDGLKTTGVSYIELRLLDINPHTPTGVDSLSLHFSHLFILYCWLQASPSLLEEQKAADKRQEEAAVRGRFGLPLEYQQAGQQMFDDMKSLANHLSADHRAALAHYQAEFINPKNLHWKKVLDQMVAQDQDFIAYHLEKAQQHHKNLQND